MRQINAATYYTNRNIQKLNNKYCRDKSTRELLILKREICRDKVQIRNRSLEYTIFNPVKGVCPWRKLKAVRYASAASRFIPFIYKPCQATHNLARTFQDQCQYYRLVRLICFTFYQSTDRFYLYIMDRLFNSGSVTMLSISVSVLLIVFHLKDVENGARYQLCFFCSRVGKFWG